MFGALSIAAALWRWRFAILLLVAIAAGVVAKLYIDRLRAERAVQDAALAAAAQANKETVEALGTVKAEKAAAEKLLADRLARKTAEANRLGKLVKHVLAIDAAGECPVGASVDAALDGLPADPAVAPVGQP